MVKKLLPLMMIMVVCCLSAFSNTHIESDGAGEGNAAGEKKPIKMIFYGNSFTGMWDIPFLVKQMAEHGQSGLNIDYMKVLAGGSKGELRAHWGRGSQFYLKLPGLSTEEIESICAEMKQDNKDPKIKRQDKRVNSKKISNSQKWLQWKKDLGKTPKFDYVVLQAWKSKYADYMRQFAKIAREHGTKPILYFPVPKLNSKPLDKSPDPEPVMKKARREAALGNELDALVIPVGLAILKVHQKRPDLTMRFVKDFHLNQVCAYLTTCCFYAAMFDESPVGLTIRGIDNPVHDKWRKYDPDGNSYNVTFSEELATLLQQSSWDAVQEVKKLQKELAEKK